MASSAQKDMWITYPENPYNYFTQPDDWYAFDISFGRAMHDGLDVCGLVARFAPTSDENLTEFENDELINEAINIVLDMYEEKYGFQLCFRDENKV